MRTEVVMGWLKDTRARVAVVTALGFGVAGCGEDGVTPVELDDIATIAAEASDVSTLAAALNASGLDAVLAGDGPFTVFAPRNAAFDALGADVVAALLEAGNSELLGEVLTYHVVSGIAAMSDGLTDGQMVTTVQGEELTIGVDGTSVTVNGANVVTADIEGSNGVIHIIDAVLLPTVDVVDRAILSDDTQTLVAALAAGELVTTLRGTGPFTVFAPVDAAFDALGTDQLDILLDPANIDLLQKVLTYHVVPGELRAADLVDGSDLATVEGSTVSIDLSGSAPMVNGAEIVATDIVAGNGVIHLIDVVLTDHADIVDVAVLNGFSTLVDLVGTAGLEATLRSDNSGNGFTVFAPTNAAFAALTAVPMGQDLVDVLTYHVVSGTVFSGDLSDGQVVPTVEGTTFEVGISGSDVMLTDGSGNTVDVVLTDVAASNGVIHVVDAVLLPN